MVDVVGQVGQVALDRAREDLRQRLDRPLIRVAHQVVGVSTAACRVRLALEFERGRDVRFQRRVERAQVSEAGRRLNRLDVSSRSKSTSARAASRSPLRVSATDFKVIAIRSRGFDANAASQCSSASATPPSSSDTRPMWCAALAAADCRRPPRAAGHRSRQIALTIGQRGQVVALTL